MLPTLDLYLETHLVPLPLIRAGYAPYMSFQSFPRKHKAYSILDLETHLAPLLLILAGNAAYLALQSFPVRPQYKDLAYSIRVWLNQTNQRDQMNQTDRA